MYKNVLTLTCLMFFITSVSISADEKADNYYQTSGNYNSSLNYWWNSSHNMYTRSGFGYNETPNGGDYVKLKNEKKVSHDYVTSYVKNANGNVAVGPHNQTSYAKIGAVRGTDYHRFKE